MRWLFLSRKTTCKGSAFSGARSCDKKVIYKHQEMTQSQETHHIKAFWFCGCPQQGTINADAAIRILNRSDNRNSVCVWTHTRDSFFTIGSGECEDLIPFEAHNLSLMFVARWSIIYLEWSLVWHDSSFTLPHRAIHADEPVFSKSNSTSMWSKESFFFFFWFFTPQIRNLPFSNTVSSISISQGM